MRTGKIGPDLRLRPFLPWTQICFSTSFICYFAPYFLLLFVYLFIYLFTSFSGHRPAQRKCTNGTQVRCEVPTLSNPTTCQGWPHHSGLQPLLFSNSDVSSFTSHKNESLKVLWDGTYRFSSLSKKTSFWFPSQVTNIFKTVPQQCLLFMPNLCLQCA